MGCGPVADCGCLAVCGSGLRPRSLLSLVACRLSLVAGRFRSNSVSAWRPSHFFLSAQKEVTKKDAPHFRAPGASCTRGSLRCSRQAVKLRQENEQEKQERAQQIKERFKAKRERERSDRSRGR